MAVNPGDRNAPFNFDVLGAGAVVAPQPAPDPLGPVSDKPLAFDEIKDRGWLLASKLVRPGDQEGLNNIGGVDTFGRVIYRRDQACHAVLRRDPFDPPMRRDESNKLCKPPMPELRLYIDYSWGRAHAQRRLDTEPVYREFFNWWLKEGPYSRIFIRKDADWVVENGAWCFTNTPCQYVIGGVQPLRYVNENEKNYNHGSIIETWGQFKDIIDPAEAFILAHILRPSGPSFIENSWVYHVPLTPSHWSRAMMKRFIQGKPRLDGTKPFRFSRQFSPLCSPWNKGKGYGRPDWSIKTDRLGLARQGNVDAFGMALQVRDMFPVKDMAQWLPKVANQVIRGDYA